MHADTRFYQQPHSFKYRIANGLEEVTVRSWWVGIVLLLSFTVYEQAAQRTAVEHRKLSSYHQTLQREKEEALVRQQQLVQQIHSQSDPAWIEIILKSNLGLVPEGQTKVYFKHPTTNG